MKIKGRLLFDDESEFMKIDKQNILQNIDIFLKKRSFVIISLKNT